MKKVQRRLADITTKKRDFFSYILTKREGLGITDWGLASYTNALIVAGSETSATTLSGLFYCLLKDERVYSKLKAEIRGAFKTPAAVTAHALSTLPYLTACIEEALCIYPPIPIALPRLVPEGGCVIDGYSVPGSTTVGVHAWTVTRDPSRFKDPDMFRPECSIDNTDNDNLEASRPFLAGTRMCMGINMAWIEVRLLAAKLVLSFDMEMVDTTLDRNEQECYTLWQKPQLMVTAKKVVWTRMWAREFIQQWGHVETDTLQTNTASSWLFAPWLSCSGEGGISRRTLYYWWTVVLENFVG